MIKPTCKLCNHAHYSHEPHVWKDEPAPKPAKIVVANKVKVANNGSLHMVANKESRHGKYADLDKRREYMRDYMRRRRA